jgi:hypothetical protein
MAAVISLEPRFDEPYRPQPLPRLRLVEPDGWEPDRQPCPRPARRHQHAVYRRRRVLAALVGLGLVLTVARAGVALGEASLAAPERLPHVRHVVVAPGDSLWSIAADVAPGHDPRPIVDAIVEQRGTSTIAVGELLTVPAP